jgi:MoaA/NifB/PqqE/SkfB family radical SAM enzyme
MKNKFKRVYIEISNICNLQCSFCPVVERDKLIMSTSLFEKILTEVSPYTEEITLHLMGEPLAHPEFEKIISIVTENYKKTNVRANLTTNGILLNRYRDLLIKSEAIRQINFSIHSFEDNFKDRDIMPYLKDILEFSKLSQELRDDLYINYRLWNIKTQNEQASSNAYLIDAINNFFNVEVKKSIDVSSIKSKNIYKKIYFHFDSRFTWPSPNLPILSDKGSCYGCLDKEAIINLGNLSSQSLPSITESERALKIAEGFRHKLLVEDLCKRCPYITRFR